MGVWSDLERALSKAGVRRNIGYGRAVVVRPTYPLAQPDFAHHFFDRSSGHICSTTRRGISRGGACDDDCGAVEAKGAGAGVQGVVGGKGSGTVLPAVEEVGHGGRPFLLVPGFDL